MNNIVTMANKYSTASDGNSIMNNGEESYRLTGEKITTCTGVATKTGERRFDMRGVVRELYLVKIRISTSNFILFYLYLGVSG